MRKNILLLLVAVSIFAFFALPGVCFPDGCIYDFQNPVCQDGSCVNENILSHLQERSVFAAVIMENIQAFSYLMLLGFLLFLFVNNKDRLLEFQRKFRLILRRLNSHNSFSYLFVIGILNLNFW
jgi:hypothetical protein